MLHARNSSSDNPTTVVVVGGGPVGLSTAVIFSQNGFQVTLLEKGAGVPVGGAGIVLARNAGRVLAKHGLTEGLLEAGAVATEAWNFINHHGELLTTVRRDERTPEATALAPDMTIRRRDLNNYMYQQALNLGVDIHFGVTVREVDPPTGAVHYSSALPDGVAEERHLVADIIIGADGINSFCQAVLNPELPDEHKTDKKAKGRVPKAEWALQRSGNCSDNSIIPAEVVKHNPALCQLMGRTNVWVGPRAHAICFPVSHGKYYALLTSREDDGCREAWEAVKDIAKVEKYYENWDPRLRTLILSMQEGTRIGMVYRGAVPSWYGGRLVLIGDAAHAMLPFVGQGLSQGLEDVDILLLSILHSIGPTTNAPSSTSASAPSAVHHRTGRPTIVDLHSAFSRYTSLRKPRTKKINEMALAKKYIFETDDEEMMRVRDERFRSPPNDSHMLLWKNTKALQNLFEYDAQIVFEDHLRSHDKRTAGSGDAVADDVEEGGGEALTTAATGKAVQDIE